MKMPVLEAAHEVLRDAGEPLHQDQIAERINRQRLTAEKTSGRIVGERINEDISKQGDASRFEKVGPETFQLRWYSSPAVQLSVKPPPAQPGLTFKDAAFEILKASGKPMHYRDITQQALAQKLIITKGKTPADAMFARITDDIRHCKSRDVHSRFVNLGRGMFALSSWKSHDLARESEGHSQTVIGAAYIVLREVREPLHQDQIAEHVLRRRLRPLPGKTPGSTVGSKIYMDIKNKGAASRFVQTAPATFGLRGSSAPAPAAPPAGKPAPEKPGLSFKEAAFRILSDSKDKKPMHYRDITQQALEKKLIVAEGKTPASTMSASLAEDIRRCERRGVRSRFVRHGRGMFGLSRWEPHALDQEIERHNQKVREKLLQRLQRMPPKRFEELIAELLGKMGFEDVETTSPSRDGGIDVRGVLVEGDVIRTRMAVQVKRWGKGRNVQAPVVQQVRGSLGAHEQGLIITTSAFSSGAVKEAERSDAAPVGLMSGEQLVLLLFEHELGVERRGKDLFELDSDLFEENGEEPTD